MRWWNSSRSTRPSPFSSVSANAACGSPGFLGSSAKAGSAARTNRVVSQKMRCMGPPLVLDLPAAVGLPAGRAVGLLLLATDHHVLAVLAAVLTARGLIGMGRRDGARVARVGVRPSRR